MALASGRRAASKHRATAPVTCGAAMLVPDLRVSRPGLRVLPGGADRAARISTPGAAQVGLPRPSRVGPALLNGAGARAGCVGVVGADDERQVAVGDGAGRAPRSASAPTKRAWHGRQASSRSSQAWNRPLRTSTPSSVTRQVPAGADG